MQGVDSSERDIVVLRQITWRTFVYDEQLLISDQWVAAKQHDFFAVHAFLAYYIMSYQFPQYSPTLIISPWLN